MVVKGHISSGKSAIPANEHYEGPGYLISECVRDCLAFFFDWKEYGLSTLCDRWAGLIFCSLMAIAAFGHNFGLTNAALPIGLATALGFAFLVIIPLIAESRWGEELSTKWGGMFAYDPYTGIDAD